MERIERVRRKPLMKIDLNQESGGSGGFVWTKRCEGREILKVEVITVGG